jgi:enterochelin esterase family protein
VTKIGGTPLVECSPAQAPNCLVTFLWRGDASTKNVLVLSEALPGKPAKHLFRHISGTDLWYRTYTFRDDARFMYMLSINDPLIPWEVEGSERKKRYAGVRADPLNQRNWCYVSLPRAPSERWVEERAGIPHGEIRRHKLPSMALSGEREVEVYVTPKFQPGQGITPVLILFDGEESKVLRKVPVILDNLFVEGRLPPLLAVFLIQPHEQREHSEEQRRNLTDHRPTLMQDRNAGPCRDDPGRLTSAVREAWAAPPASGNYRRSSAVRLASKCPPQASAW